MIYLTEEERIILSAVVAAALREEIKQTDYDERYTETLRRIFDKMN